MTEENVIDTVFNCIKLDKDRFEKNELGRVEIESFNLCEFWTKLNVAVQALNNEVTKIGFVCGKKPFPNSNEVSAMLQDLLRDYNVMKDLYLVLPQEVGLVLFKAVTLDILAIMRSLLDFVKSLHNLSEKGSRERLTLTGTFWDACNSVDSLPKDNFNATLRVLQNEVSLAADAQEELESTMEEAGEDEDNSWTNSEYKLVTSALGLVKTTRFCVTRLHVAVEQVGPCAKINQLDLAASTAQAISPALDNFVSELYHPVDFPAVFDTAAKLVEVLRSVLSMVRESDFSGTFGLDKISEMERYISHNHAKVDPSSVNPVPELANLSTSSDSHVTGYETRCEGPG